MSFTFKAGERSVARGPPSSGSSPKCRALSLSMPARCSTVGCGYWVCAGHDTKARDASHRTITARPGNLFSMHRLPGYLHGVDLLLPGHIGAEDNPFPVRSKVHIRFQRIIVL